MDIKDLLDQSNIKKNIISVIGDIGIKRLDPYIHHKLECNHYKEDYELGYSRDNLSLYIDGDFYKDGIIDGKALVELIRMDPDKDTGKISDGFHTFDELYQHRITLFLSLISVLAKTRNKDVSIWWSKLHHDGSSFEGWILVCIQSNGEQISYHIEEKYIPILENFEGVMELETGLKWDGHTPSDVIDRLTRWFL